MSESLEDFLKVERDLEDARLPRRAHPQGWEPGVDTSSGSVTFLSNKAEPPRDWSEVIRQFSLDPGQWTVDEAFPVQIRTWDAPSGERLFYYRATVKPVSMEAEVDVEKLVAEVKRRKPAKRVLVAEHDRSLVVCLADWQAGKADFGGPEALVERLLRLKKLVPERVRELKKSGFPVDSIYVVGMGDMVENCSGHYEMQEFSVALDLRQQTKLVRRMLVEMLSDWSKLTPRMVVGCVPGNHGERRRGKRAYTSFEDNTDLEVFEQAAEIMNANPDAFGNVSWVLPDGDMTITLNVSGTTCSFAHGHQARRGSGPANRLKNWWKDKMAANHPVGDASVLVSAHYHHLQVVQDGNRTWMQCPAMDGGSRWYEEQGGQRTACGTLTFTADEFGWDNVKVLR